VLTRGGPLSGLQRTGDQNLAHLVRPCFRAHTRGPA
jgi:hypothetical protein